jgi:hypothetical protein
MRNKETMRKLLEMRLSGMVEIYEEQTRNLDYEKMTFNQRFNLIVDYEYSRRQSNKLNRLLNRQDLAIQQLLLKTSSIILIAI